jgi:hypothetical protein
MLDVRRPPASRPDGRRRRHCVRRRALVLPGYAGMHAALDYAGQCGLQFATALVSFPTPILDGRPQGLTRAHPAAVDGAYSTGEHRCWADRCRLDLCQEPRSELTCQIRSAVATVPSSHRVVLPCSEPVTKTIPRRQLNTEPPRYRHVLSRAPGPLISGLARPTVSAMTDRVPVDVPWTIHAAPRTTWYTNMPTPVGWDGGLEPLHAVNDSLTGPDCAMPGRRTQVTDEQRSGPGDSPEGHDRSFYWNSIVLKTILF